MSVTIPSAIAKGSPSTKYPFSFAINTWIEGETVSYERVKDLKQLAIDLAKFLKELQSIDASLGPAAGEHNFYRGGYLGVYNDETRAMLEKLKDIFDVTILENIWNKALKSKYSDEPVWVHGDVAVGNLLVKNGKLSSVIDFGILGTGDPACDYVMAWTFFDDESRKVFKEALDCDKETLNRAKGWALWKALITYDTSNEKSINSQWAKQCIKELLKDNN
ncbi:MAG: aminoglycoside phosphotransferase family protein [Clostridium sp.]